MENKEEKYIENEVNKKTLETDDIYIENPTNEINNKKLKSHKIKLLYLIIPIIIVIIGIVYLVNFYKENGTINIFSYTVKKEELVEMLKQYDNAIYLQEETAKVGAIIDYDYNEYDKLLTYSCIYKNEQTTLEAGGIVLINSNNKNFKFISFDMSNMGLIYYLIANNEKDKLTEVSKILGNYIKENQVYEINETKNRENYMAIGKEIGKVVGVTLCREIGEDYMRRYTVYQEGVTDLLYKKDEIYSRYIGIPTTEQEYCWTIIPEETAKLYYNINRKTYNTLVALYGQPYKTVQKYSVFESGDGEETVLVKSYDSKEEAKRDLGVEELGDHNSYTYTEDKTDSTDNNKNYNNVNSTDTVIQENDDENKENNTQKEEQDITKEEETSLETPIDSEEISSTTNEDENLYVEEEEPISIGNFDTSDKTFNQIKLELEEKGLKAESKTENVTVPYLDERAGKEYCIIEDKYKYKSYNKGDTVLINRTIYNKGAWNITIRISLSQTIYTYKGKECYTAGTSLSGLMPDRYCCFVENPTSVSDTGIFSDEGKGVKVYINDKVVGEGFSMDVLKTFTNEEEIKIKILAPYIFLYDTSEYKVVDKNVTLFETTIKLKNLYEEAHGYEVVDIPSLRIKLN